MGMSTKEIGKQIKHMDKEYMNMLMELNTWVNGMKTDNMDLV